MTEAPCGCAEMVARRCTVRTALAAVVALVILAGCGLTTGDSSAPTTAQPVARASPSQVKVAPSTTTISRPGDSGDQKSGELTGFGATVAAWESVHGGSVSGYTKGSVYGGVVRDSVHEYIGVAADPLVTMYTRGFPPDTSLDAAKRLVMKDFPPDARMSIVDDDEPACEIALIESRTVKQVTEGWAIAAFVSEQDPAQTERTPLNRSNVSDAIVMGHYEGREQDLGTC